MNRQVYLENTPGLLVNKAADPLHTTPSSKSSDCRLSDALHKISNYIQETTIFKRLLLYLDVVPQHLAVSLGTTLAQTLASFSSSSHNVYTLLTVIGRILDIGTTVSLIIYQV